MEWYGMLEIKQNQREPEKRVLQQKDNWNVLIESNPLFSDDQSMRATNLHDCMAK